MAIAMLEQKTIKVAVVEPVTIVREALSALFKNNRDFELVSACTSAAESLETLAYAPPDVVLIDAGPRCLIDFRVIDRIRSVSPRTKIVLLGCGSDEYTLRLAAKSGAEGYIGDSVTSEHLLDTVRLVAEGKRVFDQPPALLAFDDCGSQASRGVRLSSREKEIVALVCQGLTNQEIAEAAFVSVNTVKTHLRRIFERLGISSRRELSRMVHGSGRAEYPAFRR